MALDDSQKNEIKYFMDLSKLNSPLLTLPGRMCFII